MMMAFLAAGTLAYVDERCGRIPPRLEQCTGMLEFILVVDNSWSMREHYDGISEFMRRVTDSFELDAQREFSPRVSIITIAGCQAADRTRTRTLTRARARARTRTLTSGYKDSKGQHAQMLHPLSDNADSIKRAIDGRPAPSRDKGYTCISCGLDLAASLLRSMKRSDAKPIIGLLTDGEQTVWGLNHAAMEASDELKNAGADIIAMSLGTFPRVALRVPSRREGPLTAAQPPHHRRCD